jgi:glutamine amidotransferase PdxT
MATSFHPEVGSDSRIHRVFVDLVTKYAERER